MIKNNQKSRILVILPTLGQRTELLRQTLLSVQNQMPVLYDIVMIYPLENSDTAKLAEEFNALSIEDPGSISAALNVGIKTAKPNHEFISWIGDDDLVLPQSFQTAISALDKNPKAVLAFGYCDYINDDGKKILTSRAGSLAPWLMTWGPNLVPCPGILFRLSSLKKAGEFDITNKYSMDLDMLLRLRRLGKFINTRTTLAAFRWHPVSTTVANRKASLKEAKMVKRRYLPKYLRPIAPVWEIPVHLATILAARKVNKLTQ